MSRASNSTPEARMTYYTQKALPESINEISKNHEALMPVVEYLENAYLSADSSPAQQLEREVETKMYLTDALGAVVQNINVVAKNLEDLVGLQVDAVDSLATQMTLIKTRLQVCKEQHGAERLHTLRVPVPPPSGEYSRKTAPAPKDDDELPSYDAPPSAGIRMESLQELQAAPPEGAYTRIPLSMRMSKFDEVGVCLQREEKFAQEAPPAPPASGVYDRVRRSSNAGIRPSIGGGGSFRGVEEGGPTDAPPFASSSAAATSPGGDLSSRPPSGMPPPKLSSRSGGPPPPLSKMSGS